MSKIQNPVVLIYKRENSDTYAVAITSGSQDYRDAVLMATMEPDMTGDSIDTWSKTGYYMTAEIKRLKQALSAAESNLPDSECHVAVLKEALRDKQALPEASEKYIAEPEAEPVSQTYKLAFLEWLSEQKEKIDIDCGCVSIETLMHWMRLAYEAGNSPVTPDGWISCSERMPEKSQSVLISVNFDSSLVEPLICSALYTGSTFRRGDATIKPGNGIERVTHWMPLPEPPQEVNQ
ncbi:DUF551 domain-containing protein [Escherichia coli]|uniref:DUF551 domain-containing protein n=1 Tax=Escherichia coli TaxID=562 RepID=UPI000AABE94D|nr:DUF551 domain-containing protein [Escherichia coli]